MRHKRTFFGEVNYHQKYIFLYYDILYVLFLSVLSLNTLYICLKSMAIMVIILENLGKKYKELVGPVRDRCPSMRHKGKFILE